MKFGVPAPAFLMMVVIGCSQNPIIVHQDLATATTIPVLFAETAALIAECPMAAELEDLNRSGATGRLHIFEIEGTLATEAGVQDGALRIAVPSIAGSPDELTPLDGSEWSVRLLSPREWSGDECAGAVDVAFGASFRFHQHYVIPFGEDQYCVLSYDELTGGPDLVCSGERVGPIEDWEQAVDDLSP